MKSYFREVEVFIIPIPVSWSFQHLDFFFKAFQWSCRNLACVAFKDALLLVSELPAQPVHCHFLPCFRHPRSIFQSMVGLGHRLHVPIWPISAPWGFILWKVICSVPWVPPAGTAHSFLLIRGLYPYSTASKETSTALDLFALRLVALQSIYRTSDIMYSLEQLLDDMESAKDDLPSAGVSAPTQYAGHMSVAMFLIRAPLPWAAARSASMTP